MKRIAEISRQGITCIKNANNPYFNSKYADLATVVEALKEPLEKVGLGYSFRVDNTMDGSGWMVILTVADIEEDKSLLISFFPITSTEPQKMGSAITYAKRYLLTTVFNVIAEEDDDGNAAQGNKPTQPMLRKKSPSPLMPAAKVDVSKEVNDEIPNFFK